VNAWDILLIAAFLTMGVVALWFPIMMFATMFSGWWDLARRFPRTTIPADARRGVGTVVLSPLFRYKGVVTWAADHDHLHLSLPLIGVFHDPISIPFAELRFFAGDRRVMGLTPVEVNGKRMLVSRGMVEREAVIRRELGTLDEQAERDLFPDDQDHSEHNVTLNESELTPTPPSSTHAPR
jgi:hypothetical protein